MTRALDFASQIGVTPPDGDADGTLATTGFVAGLKRGFIDGLTLSRTTTTTFTVAPGVAANEDASARRVLVLGGSGITKSLSSWVQGNNNGSLDTGTIAANTWYHAHLIHRLSDNAVDVLISLSPTNPTLPANWVARRILGSFLTNGSSQITPFIQQNDIFLWDTPVADVNATNPGSAAVTRTLSVPTGRVVFPIVSWGVDAAAATAMGVYVSPLSIADSVPSSTLTTVRVRAATASGGSANSVVRDIPTNTSAQVRTRCETSSASDILRATTLGWVDPRGKG